MTNIKYAKRWYEFYNQENIIRHQAGDEFPQRPIEEILHQAGEEFEMPVDFGRVPWKLYVSAVDELLKQPDDNPTIGLLICKSKDNTIVEWSFRGMNQPLGVAEYKLGISQKAVGLLPSEAELQRIIDTYDNIESDEPPKLDFEPQNEDDTSQNIVNEPQNEPQCKEEVKDYPQKTLNQLLHLIHLNPKITKMELARELGVSTSTLKRWLKANRVVWYGPSKSGHWEILPICGVDR